jgi:nucleotide-binding universal stress UspA family protein
MPVSVLVQMAVGKPAEQILRVAREAGEDLIVMGTHGRTG